MKIKSFILPVILPVIITACSNNKPVSEKSDVIPVEVYEVISENYQHIVHSSGRLSTSLEQKLSFKTGGIIQKIHVDEGQTVNKGDVLANLDLSEIQSHVTRAWEAYQKAERDYKRVVSLYNDSVTTLEQLQNAKTMLQISKSDYEIAAFNMRHSTIVAPSKGRILKKLMEEHELAGQGYPVILFGSTEGNWIVRIHVTDRDRVNLKTGDTALIRLDPYPGEVFHAEISELADAADPYTGTFEVELRLKAGVKQQLLTGMIARAEIYADHGVMVSVIPVEALMKASGNKGYVLEVINGIPVKRTVSIVEIRQQNVLVSDDLKPGTMIITENVNLISDSTAITITKNNN
ncbi:MAG: efflux RND transporter periplasmic adaptor subunit [Bacteroidales bacterium]|nr:efflux RND transporter periplasmic adaptor subunit [Bacteroidales bacterium]MBN2761485.1 efflux RND transporter periplasmic adaptor subunit [Bacteroidales bacterium]